MVFTAFLMYFCRMESYYRWLVTIAIIIAVLIILLLTRELWLPLFSRKKITCKSRLLFAGDSLTVFSESYAEQLKRICPELYYKKVAQVGEQTSGIRISLDNELSTSYYDGVSVWAGINDIYGQSSITSAKANLQAMYDAIRKSGAKVIALTIPPSKAYPASSERTIALTNELNSWIRNNKSVDFVVDAYSVLSDGGQGTKREFLQGDLLHLNNNGQKMVSDKFISTVFTQL